MSEEDSPGDRSRVVLVTGGSRGIGAACVAWFVANGDRVAFTSRNECPARSDGALGLTCDVTRPDQIEAAFTEIEQQFGPVEVLVSNAGITRDTLIARMSEFEWGPFLTLQQKLL